MTKGIIKSVDVRLQNWEILNEREFNYFEGRLNLNNI